MRTERTAKINGLVKAGRSYTEIAEMFALSAERIRQLHRQHLDFDPVEEERRKRNRENSAWFRGLQRDAFRAYRTGNNWKAGRILKELKSGLRDRHYYADTPRPSRNISQWDRRMAKAAQVDNGIRPIVSPNTRLSEIKDSRKWAPYLLKANIHTVADVHACGARNLLKIRQFGFSRWDMAIREIYGL